MRTFSTYIKAVNPNTGDVDLFCGPNIEGPSAQWAREFCDSNGLGYLFIGDELIAIIPCVSGNPDFYRKVDLRLAMLN